jgi:pimeloyl-ACP methyl ester carboxylesterase
MAVLFALFAAPACAPYSITDYAARHEMTVRQLEGDGFEHLVVERPAASSSGSLHIYIEGDGIPWAGNLPSADPTPRDMLAIRLMDADHGTVAYVGRPCYFGMDASSGRCHPSLWTSQRYGAEVVRSMAAVIAQLRSPSYADVVLIGHSGGGVLAVLLESEVEGVKGVITVGANLDTDAWTRHHGYDPLDGSINPMTQSRNGDIPHLQYIGVDDDIVPPATAAAYASLHPGVELIEKPGFGHVCCWERAWPEILRDSADHFASAVSKGPKRCR